LTRDLGSVSAGDQPVSADNAGGGGHLASGSSNRIGGVDKLVRSTCVFVVSVAKKYQNQGVSLSDLINEATSA